MTNLPKPIFCKKTKRALSKIILLSCLTLVSTSCVYMSQDVKLNPQVNSYSSKVGKNDKIDVVVTDKRDDKTVIGRRGNGMAAVAPINNRQNLEELIRENVAKALQKNGFVVVKNNDRILDISLLTLKYQNLFGFFTIGSKIDSVLDVSVRNSSGAVLYKNIYRSNLEKRHFMFAPLAYVNEKNINSSFQDVLEEMLNDENLIKFLCQ